MNGFYTKDVHYGDTDSINKGSKHWEKSDKAGLLGKKAITRKKRL